MGDKSQKLEEEMSLMKEKLHDIQRAKPLWVIETTGQLGGSLQVKQAKIWRNKGAWKWFMRG